MIGDVEDLARCLRAAERLCRSGRRGRAIKKLEAALWALKNPIQKLPLWVKAGTRLMWASPFKQTLADTMVVTSVCRGPRGWRFTCQRKSAEGVVTSICTIEQHRGKRCWKRYVA